MPSTSSEPSTPAPTCSPSASTIVGIYSQPSLNGAGVSCFHETYNLLSIVEFLIKTDDEFATFTTSQSVSSFGDTSLETKLAAMNIFIMVDIEGFGTGTSAGTNKLSGWNPTSQAILKDFVSTGGTLLMTGTPYGSGGDVIFLNEAFEWNLSSVGCSSSTNVNINAANTAGTPWEGGPTTLGCPSGTNRINCNSEECYPMWGDETSAIVAVLPHGSGQVVYLGFDFYNTGYEVDGFHRNCGNRESPWVTSVLRSGLLQSAGC
eukprot:scaffold11370_cov197-Skeletonema_dohrnii-CCMP3373.AAC.1